MVPQDSCHLVEHGDMHSPDVAAVAQAAPLGPAWTTARTAAGSSAAYGWDMDSKVSTPVIANAAADGQPFEQYGKASVSCAVCTRGTHLILPLKALRRIPCSRRPARSGTSGR